MCGIVGLINKAGELASPAIIKRLTATLAHRGPDGEGTITLNNVAFGHRRLAIIDLSDGGHQPMMTQDQRFVITYNGELYNYKELAVTLRASGRHFVSSTDTEVVLNAWAEWGKQALEKFNGMYAFAIHDRTEGKVYLVRDRYGIKPLYYFLAPDVIVFASEIRAILAHPAVSTRIDLEGLVEYLTFQNYFSDNTLFKGVRMLPAGSIATIDCAIPSAPSIRRYWDFNFQAESADKSSSTDYTEELDRLFRQAVSRQLVGDVPISAYLSGGIDSGSITAIATEQLPGMKTFTVGFDLSSASGLELGFDERAKAERLSYLYGTEHYEMVLKAGDMERTLPAVVAHLEEPRVGQSYPNYCAAYLASKFGKVVLSGIGGDEMFAGYPWRYYRAVVNDNFNQYVDKYYAYWQRMLTDNQLRRVLTPIWGQVKHVDTREIFGNVFKTHAQNLTTPEDYINHSLYFEAKTFLHGLLVLEDKLSMANGLEARVPFLDNDLVDFAMKMPVRMKLGNLGEVIRLNENEPGPKTTRYFESTQDGKLALRKAMEKYVPPDLANAVKQGFSAPDASWFKGESIDYVRASLLNRRARLYEYIDYEAASELISEHLAGTANRRLLIWSLLCLRQWVDTFAGVDDSGSSSHAI